MVVNFFPLVIPPAARAVAKLKSEELSRARALFHSRYNASSEAAATEGPVLGRLSDLLERIKELDPYLDRDNDLPALTRIVEQASHDQSISSAKLLRVESDLFDKLEKHASRLEISSMHVELLEEVLDSYQDGVSSVTVGLDKTVLDDDYEVVEKGSDSVLENFEKNTFTAGEVDTAAIEQYLESMFDSRSSQLILTNMRTSMSNYGSNILLGREEVDEDILIWCIEDLLENPLISDDKRRTLQGYLQSPIAMRELRGTVNAKSVRHWNYRNVEQGLPVTARQNLEGEYCITVEEDVIDMVYLDILAVQWSMKLKSVMRGALSYPEVWNTGRGPLSLAEEEAREYWLLGTRHKAFPYSRPVPPPPPPPMPVGHQSFNPLHPFGPPPVRRGAYPLPPHPPPPPPPVPCAPIYAKKPLRGKTPRRPMPPPIAPPPPGPTYTGDDIKNDRFQNYTKSFFLSRIPKLLGSSPDRALAGETQARLLKTLLSEAQLRLAFDGSVQGVTADFKSFASSLPHQTILTVLKFIGMPEKWLDIFSRFLKVPLNMGPIVRGTSDRILTRARGVSVGHGLEAFFGEAILFFLDMVVYRKTSSYLYRLRDKCYFVGSEQQCNTVSAEISTFAVIMGLEVAPRSMVEEPIGFLNITVSGQSVTHTIDSERVKSYAIRVRQCLAKSTTMIEWIRIWNATIGEYAAHLFGPLANIFGKDHLKAVTQAYDLMHYTILEGKDLTSHIQALLRARLKRGPHDRPVPTSYLEALIYLPHAFGGLGLKNPYNTLSIARSIEESPLGLIKNYQKGERRYYETAKQIFEHMTPAQQAEKLSNIFQNDKNRIEAALGSSTDPTVFPPFEGITAHRERTPYPPLPPPFYPETWEYAPVPNLATTLSTLLFEPRDYIRVSNKILDEVESLADNLGMKTWMDLSYEDRWVLQVYGEECIETYGSLAVWHGESVPRELLRMVRSEVDDSFDDELSLVSGSSYMSDP